MWHISGTWLGTSAIPAFDEKLGGTRLCASQIGGGTGRLVYTITPDLDLDLRGYYVQSRTDFDGYDTTPPYTMFGNDNEYGKNSQLLGYAGLTLRSPDRTLTNRIAYHYIYTDTRDYDPNGPANEGLPEHRDVLRRRPHRARGISRHLAIQPGLSGRVRRPARAFLDRQRYARL